MSSPASGKRLLNAFTTPPPSGRRHAIMSSASRHSIPEEDAENNVFLDAGNNVNKNTNFDDDGDRHNDSNKVQEEEEEESDGDSDSQWFAGEHDNGKEWVPCVYNFSPDMTRLIYPLP